MAPRVGGWGFWESPEQSWLAADCPVADCADGDALLPPTSSSFPHPAQVTTYLHKDYNNLWIIKKHNSNSGNAAENWCFFYCYLLWALLNISHASKRMVLGWAFLSILCHLHWSQLSFQQWFIEPLLCPKDCGWSRDKQWARVIRSGPESCHFEAREQAETQTWSGWGSLGTNQWHTVAALVSDSEHSKPCRPQRVVRLGCLDVIEGCCPLLVPGLGQSVGDPWACQPCAWACLGCRCLAWVKQLWSTPVGLLGLCDKGCVCIFCFLDRQLATCRLCLLLQLRREQNISRSPSNCLMPQVFTVTPWQTPPGSACLESAAPGLRGKWQLLI